MHFLAKVRSPAENRRAQRLTASEVRHLKLLQSKAPLIRVLNALRHQRFGTRHKASLVTSLMASAQRLTASEVRHRYRRKTLSQSYFVLNALRHQRFGTCCDSLTALRYFCAQRLTASEVRHTTYAAKRVEQQLKCSTPYGIRGSALDRLHGGSHVRMVLNALRHQRFGTIMARCKHADCCVCSTPYGIRGSAQEKWRSPRPEPNRAQRLTASEVRHQLSLCSGLEIVQRVLNALRHQRFGTKAASL